jgi:O-antigen ligase
MATKIEFLKWLTLAGLFIFFLRWRLSDNRYRVVGHLIIAIFLVGIFESLYGIFEFFSGHRHILHLDWSSQISSVTGTFFNRSYFAGYLLMVIPLSVGFLFSREANQSRPFEGWRHRLSSLDGKTLLIGFGVILMILGFLLSKSRMGILSLLISFSLISLLFKGPRRGHGGARIPVLIFGLALLWAVWIGLDAVIGRFFTVSEDLKWRWVLWGNTLRILKDFPFLGSGLGTFTEVFPMYRSLHVRGLITHAENDFIQLASEVGVVGVGILMALFFFLLFKAASGIRALSHGEPQRYIGIGCLVGILALMFHSTLERNVQVPANAFLFTVMWAMALRIGGEGGGERLEVRG